LFFHAVLLLRFGDFTTLTACPVFGVHFKWLVEIEGIAAIKTENKIFSDY